MVNLATKQLIVPLGKRAGYLEARQIVRELGQLLPSHRLHDDYLVKTDLWESVRGLYPAWARELLIHPEQGGKFKRGQDVVGAIEDAQGRPWVFPARYVPREAVGKEKTGLFVDPADLTVEKYNRGNAVIVHPASVIVLHGLIQENGGAGRVDEATRIPLEVAPEVLVQLLEYEKRRLWRTDGVNVGLLVRDVDDIYGRQFVGAISRPSDRFGVAVAVDLEFLQMANEVLALLPREQREALTRMAEAAAAH